MEQSFGLTFLYALGIVIWLGFLFVITLVIWKDPRWAKAREDDASEARSDGDRAVSPGDEVSG